MIIAFANDHAAIEIRAKLIEVLKDWGHEVMDYGSKKSEPVDYPDYIKKAVIAVCDGRAERAVLVCGSGIGSSIVANRFPGIRCALCIDLYSATYSRRHTDANVIALRARQLDLATNLEILRIWLEMPFDGGRHSRRLNKITKLENDLIGEYYAKL